MSIYNEISNKLDELYQKISPSDLNWIEDARRTFSIFTRFEKLKDFVRAIEYVKKEIEKDDTKKDQTKLINGILKELQRSEPDFLIENLKYAGNRIARDNKSIRDAVNNEALRMLELVRLGKRDAVVGMIMRIFTIRNVPIPQDLIEALKPKYDINLFRAFIYAFLSGFITTTEE
jgi:hypothetical protein